MPLSLPASVSALLPSPALDVLPLSGGDIASVARVRTAHEVVVCKWHTAPPAGAFPAEAAGLRALADAQTSLCVPKVLAVSEQALVMTWLEPAARAPNHEERLGTGLAELHRATAPAFGFERTTFCGLTPLDNTWTPDWPAFYRDRRLGPLIAQTARLRGWPASLRHAADRLLSRLEARLASDEQPALTHGDLWSGNHLSTAHGPALIDPAAAYTHREFELGMMLLFGGFSARVLDAMQAAHPFAPGWQERTPLYGLFHLVNHDRLFGGYTGRVDETLGTLA